MEKASKSKKIRMFWEKFNHKIILWVLFLFTLFTRFYELEARLGFGWDQVDNAWAVKKLLIDHELLLQGMVAKGNAGFHIGPFYYYLMSPIYAIFNFDPIASGVIAGLTSIVTFWVLYFCIKSLFNKQTALFALVFQTFSLFIITGERGQWPVNFIPLVSMLVFYSLYKSILISPKYILLLACTVGFSFHIHFTSIFYPIIILLTLPFFRWNKELIKYVLLSIPLFLLWVSPIIFSNIINKGSEQAGLNNYINTYYHGFHLRRVLQLISDAFIETGLIVGNKFLSFLKYVLPIIFIIDYFNTYRNRKGFIMIYLVGLWYIVPWFVFSTYSGEITNYYFFITRPASLFILGYIIYRVYTMHMLFKIAVTVIIFLFCLLNLRTFISI